MIPVPYSYTDLQEWLRNYSLPTQHLTDKEVRECYEREARARVLKLRDEQVKEILCAAARRNPKDNFVVSLAGALVSASDADFCVLRPAALLIIERHQL